MSERLLGMARTWWIAWFGYFFTIGGLAMLDAPRELVAVLSTGVVVLPVAYLIVAVVGARLRRASFEQTEEEHAELTGTSPQPYLRSPVHVAVLWGAGAFVVWLPYTLVVLLVAIALEVPLDRHGGGIWAVPGPRRRRRLVALPAAGTRHRRTRSAHLSHGS